MRQDIKDYIKPEDLKEGGLYRISARNASYGIWCEKDNGFYISRHKFGVNYLFIEIHWDLSDGFGTVKPLEWVKQAPFDTSELKDWNTPPELAKKVVAFLNDIEKCPCGGYYNDWHSHASDCIIIDRQHGKQYKAP